MIPFAVLSGNLKTPGEEDLEIRILELAPDGFTFRLPHSLQPHPELAVLHFYDFKAASCQELVIHDFRIECEQTRRFYKEYRLTTDDTGYRDAVKRLTSEYLRYIHLKSEEDDAALSEALVNYPAEKEDIYPESFDFQKKTWFAPWDMDAESINASGNTWAGIPLDSFELALSLDRPDAWNRYLELPLDAFAREFWKQNHLSGHPIAQKQTDCLYIGNQFCHILFPEDALLFRILDKTRRDGVKAVLAFPYVEEHRLNDVGRLLEKLAAWCRSKDQTLELVINDWGMLSMIHEAGYSCFSLALGLLLNKRRKDVRLPYKNGFDRYGNDLSETALQADFYVDYLREHYHIRRISCESCGYPIETSPWKASLHFPFYQMNTSQYCTLYARCKNGDRGKQCPVTECPEYCRDRVFLYPEFLHMIGRYNSLFGYDAEFLTDGNRLSDLLDRGVDRLVAELL